MLAVKNKSFVEGGFSLPDCKSDVAYKDRDTLLVGTDFPGRSDSMTDSGYPRTVNEWKRGTPLSSAKEVFECGKEHIAAHGWVEHDHGETYEWHYRSLTVRAHPLFPPPLVVFLPAPQVVCPLSCRPHNPTLTLLSLLWQFYTSEKFLRRYGDGSDKPVKLQVPDDDSPSTYADQLLLKLRKPWKPTGAKEE